MQFSAESQRRAAVRVLRPWLGSTRFVRLFHRIAVLGTSRPGALETIEMFVDRAMKSTTVSSVLAPRKDIASKKPHRRMG